MSHSGLAPSHPIHFHDLLHLPPTPHKWNLQGQKTATADGAGQVAGHAGGGPRHLPTHNGPTRASAGPSRIPDPITTAASPRRRRLHRNRRRLRPQGRPGASLHSRADATIITGRAGRAIDGPAGTRATATATGPTSGRRRATLLSTFRSPTACFRTLLRDPSVGGVEAMVSAAAAGGVRGSRRLRGLSCQRQTTTSRLCPCATTPTGQSTSP